MVCYEHHGCNVFPNRENNNTKLYINICSEEPFEFQKIFSMEQNKIVTATKYFVCIVGFLEPNLNRVVPSYLLWLQAGSTWFRI